MRNTKSERETKDGHSAENTAAQSAALVYDPRGVVEAAALTPAARPASLHGLRLGILDTTKWNARLLLEETANILKERAGFGEVKFYKKESFSLAATPELIARIAGDNDLVLTAIGD